MPTLSVLTAAYAPSAGFFRETAASVLAQQLPVGWGLEWVVQEDGPSPCLAGQVAHLPFVRYEANGSRLGAAATRNAALFRARGQLVQVLDHDDVLLPGAVATLLPRFADGSVHWAVGQVDDLTPDGSRVGYPSALPFGLLRAGEVNEWAVQHGANWPIHCAGLMMRTVSVQALGGWVGIPADDDIALFAALSAITNGYNEPTVTWLYRQHPAQTHRFPEWKSRGSLGRRIAVQRTAAVRASGLSLRDSPPVAPAPPPTVGPAVKSKNLM